MVSISGHLYVINNKLLHFKNKLPLYFSRKPRDLNEIDRWKATELRIFVLYIGKIVLKNVVHKRIYNHFLLLNVGLSILLNSKIVCELEMIEKARSIFQLFISDVINIYGPAFAV